MTFDELLQKVASEQGYPAGLVRRAAEARAGAQGVPPEQILSSWAGEEFTGETSAPAAPAAAQPVAAEAPAPEPTGPEVEVFEPVTVGAPTERPEEPIAVEEVPSEEESGLPRWLAAAFVTIPLVALLYALAVPNGPQCGSAGQLDVDPVTGAAVNCDGTPYGVDLVNFFTIGEDLYVGNCASCHGDQGGGGTGPALSNGAVLVTFNENSCPSHVEWVALGSQAWPDPTYGDNATPVGASGAIMPGFENILTPQDLAAVVLYERVAFGGQAVADAELDCGLTGDEEMVAAP